MIAKIHNYLQERTYYVTFGVILMTIITLALTLLPADKVVPDKVWTFDKLGHLLIFGGWTFLLGYYQLLTKSDTINLFTIFFIGVLFGVIVEVLQYTMPFHRTADFLDIAFDALGCFLGILFLHYIVENLQFDNK